MNHTVWLFNFPYQYIATWLYLVTLPPFHYSAALYFLKMFSQVSMRDDKAVSGFSYCSTDNLDILCIVYTVYTGISASHTANGRIIYTLKGLIAGSESGVLYKGQKLPQQMRQTTEHRCQESSCQERF